MFYNNRKILIVFTLAFFTYKFIIIYKINKIKLSNNKFIIIKAIYISYKRAKEIIII
jgi:hypothetical protein